MDLGFRLRELRQRHRLSLYDVERRVGLHFSTIAKYERNERQPGIDVLRDLAALYEVPLGALVTDVNDLEELLTAEQRQWLQLLDGRPPLANLLQVLASLSDQRLQGLIDFLAGPPSDVEDGSTPDPSAPIQY